MGMGGGKRPNGAVSSGKRMTDWPARQAANVQQPLEPAQRRRLGIDDTQAQDGKACLKPFAVEHYSVPRVIQVDVERILEVLHHREVAFLKQEETGCEHALWPQNARHLFEVELGVGLDGVA